MQFVVVNQLLNCSSLLIFNIFITLGQSLESREVDCIEINCPFLEGHPVTNSSLQSIHSSEGKSPEINLINFETECNLQPSNMDGDDNYVILPNGANFEMDVYQYTEDSIEAATEDPCKVKKQVVEKAIQVQEHKVESQLIVIDEVTPTQLEETESKDTRCDQNASSMESNVQMSKELDFYVQQVKASHDSTYKSLLEDYEYVEKIFEDFKTKKLNTLQEMTDNAQKVTISMQTTWGQLAEPLKKKYLEHLKACFSAGQWLEKSLKPKRLAECKECLLDYIGLKYGGLATIKNINDKFLLGDSYKPPSGLPSTAPESSVGDPFLVNVTYVVSPGEFYIVRVHDPNREMIMSTLNEAAFAYPIPSRINSGQMYAVRNNGGNWNRGICGKKIHLEGNSDENLFEFFMLDQGHHENISASSIRTLPSEIISYPAFARECTLNNNFQRVTWGVQETNYFKQVTKRGPMNMKVFSQEGNVLNVDLAQLPSFAEEGNIVSVRDALFFKKPQIPVSNLKLMPKFPPPVSGAPDPPKHFRVRVSSALTPALIYVHILDEEFRFYERFQEMLQTELENAENDPDAHIQHVRKGILMSFSC